MTNLPEVRFATIKQVAATTQNHERTVRRWCSAGRVRATRLPGGVEIRIEVDERGMPLPVDQPEGEE